MKNIGRRYVPKNLSPENMQRVENIKSLVQKMINSCTCFDDRRKAVYKGIDVLFRCIATTEEYEKGDRKTAKFEAEEFDVENFDNISLYSDECIDNVVKELGFGLKTDDFLKIEQEFMQNADGLVDFNELGKLATRTLNKTLTSEQLIFMKKTHFLSNFFKEQNKSLDNESNIQTLDKTVALAKGIIKNDNSIESKSNIMVMGNSVSSLANEYIEKMVRTSYEKALKDIHYAPITQSDSPKLDIVCGLPGLGKSTIFINDLKKQGFLCIDLDDIAISLSKKFNVPITDATSGNLYTLANLIHDNIVAQSMEKGYSIAIEKIGYDKKQITSISDNMLNINAEVNQKSSNYYEYSQSLLMAAGSSLDSAESNSIRNAEQIFFNNDLRGYHYSDLIRNNNCTTYAYLAVLSDEKLRSRFAEIKISDRVGCFEGLSLVDGRCATLTKGHVKKLVRTENVYGNY